MTNKIFYGWIIVGACFCFCFLFAGAGFYSFSIFIKPIEDEFGWNRAAISLTMSIYLIVSGLVGPLMGWIIDKFGPRKVMLICAMAAGACFMLVSLTQHLWYFYAIYALLAMAVNGIGIIPISNLLSKWFLQRRGTAIGIAMVGISAGGLLLAPGVAYVTTAFGWKISFLGIGLLVWALAVPLILFVVKNNPADMGAQPHGASAICPPGSADDCESQITIQGVPAGSALHSHRFWCIFGAFFLAPFAQMGVLQHQVPLIMGTGADEALAAAALGATAGIGGLGKLSFGRLSESWPFRYVVLLCFGLQALAVFALLHTHTTAMVWAYAVAFGFSMGGVVVLMPLVVSHYWGLVSYAVLLGIVLLANSLGGALGTYTSGLVYDLTGDYNYALYLFIGAYLSAILSFFMAGKPQIKTSHPPGQDRAGGTITR